MVKLAHEGKARKTRRKGLREYTKEELTLEILKIVGAGLLVAAVIAAPNLAVLYRYFKAGKKKDQRKLYYKLYNLSRGGYVVEERGAYRLTQKGEKKLEEGEVWSLPLPKTTEKERKGWHLVLYDLPAKKEKARQALRARLEELGAKRYQDSVYYHEQDVKPVLAPFAEFYGIRLNVRFLKTEKLEGIDE